MRTIRIIAMMCAAGWIGTAAYAQSAPRPPRPPAPATAPQAPIAAPPAVPAAAPPAPASPDPVVTSGEPTRVIDADGQEMWETRRYTRPVVRVGVPYVLDAKSSVENASIILGSAVIDGHVDGDLVVVMGDLRLGPTAVVGGDTVVVGGTATIAPGAKVNNALAIVGGEIIAPADFAPGGDHVVVDPPVFGDVLRGVVPWITRGLIWGRVIVPSLVWLWWVVAIFFGISVVLVLAFPKGVHACTDTLRKRPLATFVTGLLTLFLFGPATALLAVSVVGLVVVPFALATTLGAWMLGKVAVARLVGSSLLPQSIEDDRMQSLRSLVIGFALITLAYMVPVLGLLAWMMVGVFGVGTGILTLLSSLKRERPAKPVRPVVPAAVPEPMPAPLVADVPFVTMSTPDIGAPAFVGDGPVLAAGVASTPAVTGARVVDLAAFPRATFLDRLAAIVLDLLIVAVAQNFFDFRFLFFRPGPGFFLFMFVAYQTAFLAWKSTTVGGIVCSLRVSRMDGQPLEPTDAIVRGLASIVSVIAFGLGYLWMAFDKSRDRQTWHDRIAGTIVVRVPRDFGR